MNLHSLCGCNDKMLTYKNDEMPKIVNDFVAVGSLNNPNPCRARTVGGRKINNKYLVKYA